MYENSNEVGVFSRLTNSYCLVAQGSSSNFYRYDHSPSLIWVVEHVPIQFQLFLFSVFESELAEVMPVIFTSIAGCRVIGRLTAGRSLMTVVVASVLVLSQSRTSQLGNRHGLLVPNTTTDTVCIHMCSLRSVSQSTFFGHVSLFRFVWFTGAATAPQLSSR
jgi:translation initiation factor 6